MMLWQYTEEQQDILISARLHKYGKICGKMESPHSRLYTLDNNGRHPPIVAKGIYLDPALPSGEQKQGLSRALYEINNAYAVCHHILIHRFVDLAGVFGIPFLISPKRSDTLDNVIASHKIEITEALSICVQMAHAISYCKDNGILCHQDLKPANIYLEKWPEEFPIRWRVKIADFELGNAFLFLRYPYGSRPYMAPEQYELIPTDVSPNDFANVDVFAIGVMLYEMITGGRHPIGEETGLVWPFPISDKSNKWKRETPWKKWLKNGAPFVGDTADLDPDTLAAIRACLEIAPYKRPSAEQLSTLLMERLCQIDESAYMCLAVNLRDFDKMASESKQEGWPYYDQLVENINEAFPD